MSYKDFELTVYLPPFSAFKIIWPRQKSLNRLSKQKNSTSFVFDPSACCKKAFNCKSFWLSALCANSTLIIKYCFLSTVTSVVTEKSTNSEVNPLKRFKSMFCNDQTLEIRPIRFGSYFEQIWTSPVILIARLSSWRTLHPWLVHWKSTKKRQFRLNCDMLSV